MFHRKLLLSLSYTKNYVYKLYMVSVIQTLVEMINVDYYIFFYQYKYFPLDQGSLRVIDMYFCKKKNAFHVKINQSLVQTDSIHTSQVCYGRNISLMVTNKHHKIKLLMVMKGRDNGNFIPNLFHPISRYRACCLKKFNSPT